MPTELVRVVAWQSVMVVGGFESMSNVPYYLPGGRFGMKYGHGKVLDGLITDGLWDVYNDVHMVRRQYGVHALALMTCRDGVACRAYVLRSV